MPLRLSLAAFLLSLLLLTAPAYADTNLYDGTFNLSDYGSPLIWSSDPSVVAGIQQITSRGNPSDALQINLTFQAWHLRFLARAHPQYLDLRARHAGELTSITSSEDKFIHSDGDFQLQDSNIRALIF